MTLALAMTAVTRRGIAVCVLTLAACALPILMAGCATAARPTADSLVVSAATGVPVPRTYNGEYVFTFHTRWFGSIKGRFTAQPTDEGFQANTRPGVAWSMIGGMESAIGPVVAPYVFPEGMLLLWRSANAVPGGPPAKGQLGPTTIGAFSAKTLMAADATPIELTFEGGKTIAVMTVEPCAAGPMSGTDYPSLARKAKEMMFAKALDPDLLKTKDAEEYFADMEKAASVAQDDVEFLLGVGLSWRKHENVPFAFVFRREDEAARAALFAHVKDGGQASRITFDSESRIATLEPLVFLDDANVDEMFRQALALQPRAIVLDLRSAPGSDVWALRAGAWLLEKPTPVGKFFSGTQRGAALAKAEGAKGKNTTDAVWSGASVSGSMAAPMRAELDRSGGVDITLEPRDSGFGGPVAVLTSGRTSGAAEVLAWTLQREKRATIVGETTARRPTIARTYDLDDTWQIRLATFDFVGPGGERLQKRGVRPDIRVDRDAAPERAFKRLREQLKAAESEKPAT